MTAPDLSKLKARLAQKCAEPARAPAAPRARVPGDLTFGALRKANLARLPEFKNAKGEPAHTEPDGSDWSASDWFMATAGELGGAGNLIKKVRRGDVSLDEARPAIGRELADTLIYLDLLATRLGIDLAEYTMLKWNEVSARIGTPLRLAVEGPVSGVRPHDRGIGLHIERALAKRKRKRDG